MIHSDSSGGTKTPMLPFFENAENSDLAALLPEGWRSVLSEALSTPSFTDLSAFLAHEYAAETVFPPREDLFSAFRLTAFNAVRAVILGQDPYHDDGQAHGLAFSVRPGVRFPPSLRNIFKELAEDTGATVPINGSLIPWAKQGVLLLNTVLTVRAHAAASHQKHGWEEFTDHVIRVLNARKEPVIFVLWGAPAQKKLSLIDTQKHSVLCSAHPSPLSSHRGFFGSKPFSRINMQLKQNGTPEIDWRLPSEELLF